MDFKKLIYECEICNSITCVWSDKYINMDYVKLRCCSIMCKNKFIMDEILEKSPYFPSDLNKKIFEYLN
jgi:hypothetical protein